MKYEDIVTKRTYEADGKEKTIWLKCGTLRTTNEGKQFIEFNHLPNITFYVFEQKPKQSLPPDEVF